MHPRTRIFLLPVLFFAALLVMGCTNSTRTDSSRDEDGDTDTSSPDGDALPEDGDGYEPTDGDVTPEDGDGEDAEEEEQEPPDLDEAYPAGRQAIAGAARANVRFELLPGSPTTQIHPYAAFDGEGIWVVYNLPNRTTSNFEVWAVRIGPDGNQLVAPIRLSTTQANCIDPAVASKGNRLLAVWQCDTGEFPQNLHVIVRAFERDGTFVRETDTALVVTLDGSADPILGNAWMPEVVGLADGTFAVASAFAAPDATGFQIILSRFSADGEILGDSRYVSPSDGSQVYPSIAATRDGQILVSWNEQTTEEEHAALSISDTEGVFSDPWISTTETVGGTRVAQTPGFLPLFAYTVGTQRTSIRLLDARGPSEILTAGAASALNHSPQLALAEQAGFLVWVRTNQGPLDAQIHAQHLVAGTEGWATDEEPRSLNEGKAPGYFAPTALPLTDHMAFAVWAEGKSPDFVLYGMYVSVSGDATR